MQAWSLKIVAGVHAWIRQVRIIEWRNRRSSTNRHTLILNWAIQWWKWWCREHQMQFRGTTWSVTVKAWSLALKAASSVAKLFCPEFPQPLENQKVRRPRQWLNSLVNLSFGLYNRESLLLQQYTRPVTRNWRKRVPTWLRTSIIWWQRWSLSGTRTWDCWATPEICHHRQWVSISF